ncbi:hypothetical protein PAXRUDRAFT_581670 [Paxillus rubicundulus Ve08.2h10]|uniref:Uncharacterized protein n=1 Tax=Paxillus rubicundulus Ve08.2h10 TaxID=930991 RepID=A0A0D0DZB2_9AGAM|nr:hypothetical protein PAXRUDRAFT_581670 [Paxillus rubicundulus Ve08.2h10]
MPQTPLLEYATLAAHTTPIFMKKNRTISETLFLEILRLQVAIDVVCCCLKYDLQLWSNDSSLAIGPNNSHILFSELQGVGDWRAAIPFLWGDLVISVAPKCHKQTWHS